MSAISTAQSPGQDTPSHVPALDGVRAIALIAVILYHTIKAPTAQGLVDRIMLPASAGGWMGVDLFFVLSGFLVTGILLDTRGHTGWFRRFAIRRALRILPLYYLSLAALLLCTALWPSLAGSEGVALHAAQGWYWTHLVNVLVARDGLLAAPLHTGHLWSLGVEEQFYLVWPLVITLCPPARLGRLCWALVGIALATRIGLVLAYFGREVITPAYVLPFARMDTLAVGAWLATIVRRPGGLALAWQRVRTLGIVGVLGTLCIAAGAGTLQPFTPLMQALGCTTVALAAMGLLALTLRSPGAGVLERAVAVVCTLPALRYVGRRSYALYLLHNPLIAFAARAGISGASISLSLGSQAIGLVAWFAILFIVTLGLAEISWRVIEGPCLSLKDRLARTPTSLGDRPRSTLAQRAA